MIVRSTCWALKKNYSSERTCEESPSSITREKLPPASAESVVVFWMTTTWRSIQTKTAEFLYH
jgi:hypothetical protein